MTFVETAADSIPLKTWDSLFFQVRTRFTMDYLPPDEPVLPARRVLGTAIGLLRRRWLIGPPNRKQRPASAPSLGK